MMSSVMDYRSQESYKSLPVDFYTKVKRMESGGCLEGGKKYLLEKWLAKKKSINVFTETYAM